MEQTAEIVEGALSLRPLPDQDVGLEPDQHPLAVKIDAAPPGRPALGSVVQDLRSHRRVHQRPPLAARTQDEPGGDAGHLLAEQVRRFETAARGQDITQIVGQALVHPEEIALHRRLIVGRRQVGGAPVLAVPRVDELMRQEMGVDAARVLVDQRALGDAIIARLVVLQPEVRRVVAEGIEEVVLAVVRGAEQRQRLVHQPAVRREQVGCHFEGRRGIGGHVDLVRWFRLRAERHLPEEGPGQNRRIDQRRERHRLEPDRRPVLRGDRQGAAVPPSWRERQARGVGQIVGGWSRRIEQHLVPGDHGELRRRRGAGAQSVGGGR